MSVKTQTIDSWLTTHANHRPEHPALYCDGESYSYQQLQQRVAEVARGLTSELGLNRGDRIAYLGHNSAAEVVLLFAAAKLGLIFIPLNWRLAPVELNYIINDCSAKYLFHGAECNDQAAEALADLDTVAVSTFEKLQNFKQGANQVPSEANAELTDPYLIVYTSGTTGRPKGAVHTQEAVFWNGIISTHAHDFTPDDHVLNVLPLFHIGGISIQMLPCFFIGGTVSLHTAFDPAKVLDAVENEGITTSVWVPTMLRALLALPQWEALNSPSLRLLNTGSTDVPVELLERINATDVPIVQVYGTTETGPITTYQRAAEAKLTQGSIGRCGAHTQLRIVRGDGSDCSVGESGEIWVKGPNNFSHYWNNPEATKEALIDGWFRTGDIAFQDDKRLYWFSGRSKHVIISGGENIYPAELERVVNRLPGVVEAAVVARSDEKWGEVPVVVAVVDDSGLTQSSILDAFSDQVARFKQPRDVVFVDELPKNAMGKVLVDATRELIDQ
jgi:fatty-acyl-CoA synthase